MLAHSLIWYNHYDVGYQPNYPVNIISVLWVGYVIMYFGIAFFDKFLGKNTIRFTMRIC